MTQARNNKSSTPKYPLTLSPDAVAEIPDALNHAQEWWWGTDRTGLLDAGFNRRDWVNCSMPKSLVACGNLIRMHIRAPRSAKKHPRRQTDASIEFSRALASNCWIAFDPNHPFHRLYLIIKSDKAKATLKAKFWDENEMAPQLLGHVAQIAGGKHGTFSDYPSIEVKPVGIMTAVVYWANKKGDGPSYYIHQMGELSKFYPILCCDETGLLWLAGGQSTSPTPGITD